MTELALNSGVISMLFGVLFVVGYLFLKLQRHSGKKKTAKE